MKRKLITLIVISIIAAMVSGGAARGGAWQFPPKPRFFTIHGGSAMYREEGGFRRTNFQTVQKTLAWGCPSQSFYLRPRPAVDRNDAEVAPKEFSRNPKGGVSRDGAPADIRGMSLMELADPRGGEPATRHLRSFIVKRHRLYLLMRLIGTLRPELDREIEAVSLATCSESRGVERLRSVIEEIKGTFDRIPGASEEIVDGMYLEDGVEDEVARVGVWLQRTLEAEIATKLDKMVPFLERAMVEQPSEVSVNEPIRKMFAELQTAYNMLMGMNKFVLSGDEIFDVEDIKDGRFTIPDRLFALDEIIKQKATTRKASQGAESVSGRELIILDLDGTIFDSDNFEPNVLYAVANMLSLRGIPKAAVEAKLAELGNMDRVNEYYGVVYTDIVKPDGTRATGWRDFITPDRELQSLLEKLSYKYRLAVVSNNVEAPGILQRLGIFDLFESILFPHIYTELKPESELFKETCAYLSVSRENAISVGNDQKNDIESAASIGIRGILVYNPGYLRENLKRKLDELTPPQAGHMQRLDLKDMQSRALLETGI